MITANDIRACFREYYQYRFREVGLFEFGISYDYDYFGCIFDAFMISPDRQLFKGFEFKVSRSDFLSDLKPRPRYREPRPKWEYYLRYCDLFYFVSPENLIKPTEIPPPAGLVWIVSAPHGFNLRVVKRPKRNGAIPLELQRRILFYFAARAKSRSARYF